MWTEIFFACVLASLVIAAELLRPEKTGGGGSNGPSCTGKGSGFIGH
jgi:hypothetical protein